MPPRLSHRLAPQIAAALILSALAGCSNNCCPMCKGHEAEETLTMQQLPAPVAATLNREAMGGQITEIEKETKHGKPCYEADVSINGKPYQIRIAEDGTLIEKEMKHGHHEKHEDHDHD